MARSRGGGDAALEYGRRAGAADTTAPGEIAAALITLAAAVLGGKAGMHYHRKIDRAEADPALPATP